MSSRPKKASKHKLSIRELTLIEEQRRKKEQKQKLKQAIKQQQTSKQVNKQQIPQGFFDVEVQQPKKGILKNASKRAEEKVNIVQEIQQEKLQSSK